MLYINRAYICTFSLSLSLFFFNIVLTLLCHFPFSFHYILEIIYVSPSCVMEGMVSTQAAFVVFMKYDCFVASSSSCTFPREPVCLVFRSWFRFSDRLARVGTLWSASFDLEYLHHSFTQTCLHFLFSFFSSDSSLPTLTSFLYSVFPQHSQDTQRHSPVLIIYSCEILHT